MPFSLSSQLPATDRTRCNQNAGRPSRYPSARAAHESSDRPSVEELMANYQFDDALCANPPEVIGIVDDVLTVGNHFRAMSNKLTERFTNASIVGIFVARRRSRMRTSTTLTTPISSRSPRPARRREAMVALQPDAIERNSARAPPGRVPPVFPEGRDPAARCREALRAPRDLE